MNQSVRITSVTEISESVTPSKLYCGQEDNGSLLLIRPINTRGALEKKKNNNWQLPIISSAFTCQMEKGGL